MAPRYSRFRYLLGRLTFGKIMLNNPYSFMQRDKWITQNRENINFYRDILLDKRTGERGYFNLPAIDTLLKKQAHGSWNYMTLSTLATFELFNRYFIDGDDPPSLKA